MSSLVADPTLQKEKVDLLLGALQVQSGAVVASEKELERRELERRMNVVLDGINNMKRLLVEQKQGLDTLIPMVEELSWFSRTDEQTLTSIKKIIAAMKRVHKIMIQIYVRISRAFEQHHIAKAELTDYKGAADDLKELAEDLNAKFFVFPADEEFQAITKALNA